MAVKTQKFVEDIGSDEVLLTRLQVNALLTYVDALNTAIAGAADITALKAAVALIDVSAFRLLIPSHFEVRGYKHQAAV